MGENDVGMFRREERFLESFGFQLCRSAASSIDGIFIARIRMVEYVEFIKIRVSGHTRQIRTKTISKGEFTASQRNILQRKEKQFFFFFFKECRRSHA